MPGTTLVCLASQCLNTTKKQKLSYWNFHTKDNILIFLEFSPQNCLKNKIAHDKV